MIQKELLSTGDPIIMFMKEADHRVPPSATAAHPLRAFAKAGFALSLIAWCFASSLAPAVLAQSSTGLAVAYAMNEGVGSVVTDVSGNNNNGTLQTGATWTPAGKYGNALSFDGVSGYVSVPASSTLNLGSNGTIEAWVKPNVINVWSSVLAKGNVNADPPTNYGLEINSSNRFLCILGNGSSARTLSSTITVAAGTFYHVACVWNGTQLQLYVNGALNTSVAQNITPVANTSPLYIGQFGGNADRMNGTIDEVRIYNRALSVTEIQTDMNTPIAPPGPAPTVSGVNPTSGIQGQVLNAVLTGTNFLSGASCSFGTGITVNSCAFNSATQMTANITIAASATTGTRTVTVTNPDAQSATLSNAFTVNAAPPAGAAYPFSEGTGVTTADVSGNNNNGTLQTGATWTPAGKYGNALSFDGVSGYVSVPASSTLNLGSNGTIEAWVKPNVINVWSSVLAKGNVNADPPTNYGLEINSSNRFLCILGNGSSARTLSSTITVAAGTFYHVACVWNGTQLQLYVNGALNTSVAQNITPVANTSPLYIGQFGGNADRMNGTIDEVRIYNRALSATEIQTDMNTPVGGPPPPPDTTPPTVSVTAPADGTTVTGLTTLYADASDNVGVAGVQFYIDGSPSGSEVTGAPFTTTWNTNASTNGSHTITAVARDAAGNRTTSSPVSVTVVTNTTDPALVGAWSAPFNWPIVAINMVVTRAGDVMSWDGPPSNGGTSALLWSPTTGLFTSIPNNLTNMFCNAAVVLSDGRVLAIGGHSDFGVGLANADIYDPTTKLWTARASMIHPRWYPTATVLPDGQVLAMSGSDNCETCIVSIPEIYNPVSNSWTALTNSPLNVALYPLMFVLPDGRVLQAGASRAPEPTSVLDLNTRTWTTVDPTPVDGHSAVMYEPGKIMKSGTSADVSVSTAPSASTTYTLDMTQPSPKWQQTPNVAYPRAFHNLTLFPDGSVLATGGGTTRDGVDYQNAVLAAELWRPQTKTWTTMSAEQNGRLYHGTAVLLLDGRVLVAGSGRVGPAPQFNGEIFSPPYLFKGPRPTISSTPGSAAYGSTFFVSTPDASSISSVTLLRISAATHAFNMDQRFLRLNFSPVTGGLNVTAPANANMAPPGYYVLFILNSSGVPSVGAVIQIQ